MRKHLFYHFRPLILASKSCFFKQFLEPPFCYFFQICFKNCRFWDPLQNPMGAQIVPKSTKWRQNAEKTLWLMLLWAVLFQTLFSRNNSNPCAVGTSWLLKGLFVRWRLANCLFLLRLFVLCFIQHLHHLKKNIGKRPAVELSVC